ncbi:MAG: PhoH family protein [Spirochaetales bacterium]|nr:PhoH family protein [Spirochaetales bacterium]
MAETYVFADDSAESVLGPNDRNLSYLELILGSDLAVRGDSLTIFRNTPKFIPLMKRLEEKGRERGVLDEGEIYMEFQAVSQEMDEEEKEDVVRENKVIKETISVLGKTVWPKTKNQKEFINALASNQIIFASGPAGTGKTFLAIAYALEEVFSGRKNKIVMTRPVVEAGESLGFLPGDLSQKLNPYLRPLYDAMDLLLNPQQIKRLEENGTIEIAPLAYMRGRSLNNSVVILDEAQNTTNGQMRMFLTRIGESSTAVITGDPTQIDLPKKSDSGFTEAMKILCGIESLSVVRFSHRDTVRSRIVREIVKAYSLEENDGK